MTPLQRRVLRSVAWGTEHFGALVTGGSSPRRVVRRLVAMGLVKSVGMVAVCDGDGFLVHPERYREGFAITDAGEVALEDAS